MSETHSSERSGTYLSVASCNLAIEVRSSVLVAADKLVRGVFVELPLTDPEGVVVPVVVEAVSLVPLPFAACLAAFSANRFCFDADFTGGMMIGGEVV